MANHTIIAPEEWAALRLASIKGVPDEELAEKFGVKASTIRTRRCRDAAWTAAYTAPGTWGNVAKKVAPAQEKAENQLKEVISDNLEAIARENPLLVARFGHKAMQEATKNELIPLPSTWQEFSIANKMVREAVGLNKEAPAVTVNLWGAEASFSDSSEWREVESVCSPEQEDWL